MKAPYSKTHHYERCFKCKETVRRLLEKIYGKAEPNYTLEIATHPENFRGTIYYGKLKDIFEALQNNRGFKEFVKAITLPAVISLSETPDSLLNLTNRNILHYHAKFHFNIIQKKLN